MTHPRLAGDLDGVESEELDEQRVRVVEEVVQVLPARTRRKHNFLLVDTNRQEHKNSASVGLVSQL